MTLRWTDTVDDMGWVALVQLYRQVPLGNKSAGLLQVVFVNSRFRCFVWDGARPVPGKEGFHRKLGFLHMRTAMAIFADPDAAVARGDLDAN